MSVCKPIYYNSRQTIVVTILIHGRDQRDQQIIFDAVHVMLVCMSEIMDD